MTIIYKYCSYVILCIACNIHSSNSKINVDLIISSINFAFHWTGKIINKVTSTVQRSAVFNITVLSNNNGYL